MTEREKLVAELERAKAKAHTNALREYDLKRTERKKLQAKWNRTLVKFDDAREAFYRADDALTTYDRLHGDTP